MSKRKLIAYVELRQCETELEKLAGRRVTRRGRERDKVKWDGKKARFRARVSRDFLIFLYERHVRIAGTAVQRHRHHYVSTEWDNKLDYACREEEREGEKRGKDGRC